MNAQMKAAAGKVPLWLWIAGPLLVLGFFGWEFWRSGREIDTDNAYVKAERVMVSAQVPGRVVEVAVAQNQPVRKGQLLFRLDPEPLRIALEQAQARLALVGNQADASRAQVRGAGSSISSADETVRWAERDLARMQDLAARQLVPRKMLDDARHALAEARMQRDAARASQAEAAAALGGDAAAPVTALPEYRAALAAVERARFDLQQASVYAPVAGVVGGHDLQPGEYLNAGQIAMPLVATDPVWVEANFKETDMDKLRVGQPADIVVDGYPGEHWQARAARAGSRSSKG